LFIMKHSKSELIQVDDSCAKSFLCLSLSFRPTVTDIGHIIKNYYQHSHTINLIISGSNWNATHCKNFREKSTV